MLKFTLTRDQFAAKRAEALSKYGLTIPGDQGMVIYLKVKTAFRYSAADQLLRLVIIEKPFSLPMQTITNALNTALGA